jgi:hypothetical protein
VLGTPTRRSGDRGGRTAPLESSAQLLCSGPAGHRLGTHRSPLHSEKSAKTFGRGSILRSSHRCFRGEYRDPGETGLGMPSTRPDLLLVRSTTRHRWRWRRSDRKPSGGASLELKDLHIGGQECSKSAKNASKGLEAPLRGAREPELRNSRTSRVLFRPAHSPAYFAGARPVFLAQCERNSRPCRRGIARREWLVPAGVATSTSRWLTQCGLGYPVEPGRA